tara:strand:- start:672 stop:1094 length:423 start_codon:yes stop_codon:yes gene_type:complete
MTKNLTPPTWIKVTVILLLIWNFIGILSFLMDQTVDPSTLDPIQKEFRTQFPLWTKIVYAIAVGFGTIGTIALFKIKKWSKKFLIASLLCVIVQMYHSLFVAGGIETFGATAAILPGIVIFLALFSVWIADLHKLRGWFI